MISLIAAYSKNRVIGINNTIPWRLSTDQKRFATLTRGNTVVMGRKTFQSIFEKLGKPLPDRESIVVTRDKNFNVPGCVISHSLDEAFKIASSTEIFIGGGEEIYRASLPFAHRLYLTEVDLACDGDTFFPDINKDEWNLVSQETIPADDKNQYPSTFSIFERK